MPNIDNNITKNANINPRKIVNFRKCAEINTCENIYVHSIWLSKTDHRPGHRCTIEMKMISRAD